jgi:membrane protease YdiL (CAAX protease family)
MTTDVWQNPERHSLQRTVFLHFLPGVAFTLGFFPAAWLANQVGAPIYLALLVSIPLLLFCEVGVLVAERKRLHWSWRTIVIPCGDRGNLILDILLSVAALYAIAQLLNGLGSPLRTILLNLLSQWLPPWLVFSGLPVGISPETLWLGLLLSGLAASTAEELYCRAFLLPRMPVSRRWAPAVNAALHSLSHFYSPWNYLGFFLAFLPLATYVRMRGNVLPTIVTHILFNSIGVILALTGIQPPY